jgi:hypothetical protein
MARKIGYAGRVKFLPSRKDRHEAIRLTFSYRTESVTASRIRMIFNIYHDGGDRVCGTVIPDSYSSICRIRASVLGRKVGVFPTDEFNQGVRDVGAHETGLVNFSITEEKLPGLATFEDLELHEADSNLLLYRRFRPGMISQKFLRLETQLLPLWRLDEAVKHRFQQYYREIEALGRGCTTQLFHLSQDSIYASGRILIKNFMFCVDNGFKFIAMVRDPYEELAERLLVMNKIEKGGVNPLGERELMNLREAIDYSGSLPIDNERAFTRALRRMPMDVAMSLANPVVRQFSTSILDEQPSQGGVAAALDVLAQSSLVGLRVESEQFASSFGELVSEDLTNISLFPVFPKVIELAEIIRGSGYCDTILEKDLELYGYVLESRRRAAMDADSFAGGMSSR